MERRGGQDRTTEFAAVRSAVTLIRLLLWSSENKSLFGAISRGNGRSGESGYRHLFLKPFTAKRGRKMRSQQKRNAGSREDNFPFSWELLQHEFTVEGNDLVENRDSCRVKCQMRDPALGEEAER